MQRDKKAVNKWPKFVLIDKTGHVYCRKGEWAIEVQRDLVEKILAQLYEQE
jgi:3-dehydroquinate synthetase